MHYQARDTAHDERVLASLGYADQKSGEFSEFARWPTDTNSFLYPWKKDRFTDFKSIQSYLGSPLLIKVVDRRKFVNRKMLNKREIRIPLIPFESCTGRMIRYIPARSLAKVVIAGCIV